MASTHPPESRPALQCFLCLGKLADGTPTITVGPGFTVHKDCYESEDDD